MAAMAPVKGGGPREAAGGAAGEEKGKHCCIGIARFSQAMRDRQLQPRCSGVHVIVQGKPRQQQQQQPAAAAEEAGERPPAAPRDEASKPEPADPDWQFTCYGYSDWASVAGKGAAPRCRFGYRPARERERETAGPPQVAPEADRPSPGPPPRPVDDATWERSRKRLEALSERWSGAGSALYRSCERTADKVGSRDFGADAAKLQLSMGRTASRLGDSAASSTATAYDAIARLLDRGGGGGGG